MPVPEGKYTVPPMGRFGAWRIHGRHRGVDQYAAKGTIIRAASEGVVTSTGFNPDTVNGFGHWVRYRHDDGHTVLEAHMLGSSLVKVGERFERGRMLGRVGDSGNAWRVGAHSHVEVRRPSGTLIDPTPYLRSLEPELTITPPTIQPEHDEEDEDTMKAKVFERTGSATREVMLVAPWERGKTPPERGYRILFDPAEIVAAERIHARGAGSADKVDRDGYVAIQQQARLDHAAWVATNRSS